MVGNICGIHPKKKWVLRDATMRVHGYAINVGKVDGYFVHKLNMSFSTPRVEVHVLCLKI